MAVLRSRAVHPNEGGDDHVFEEAGSYLRVGGNISFPGPLLSKKMQKEDLLRFIQYKSQECFQHLDKPDQKEAFLYWMIMELICSKDANVLPAEIASVLFKCYALLRSKLRAVENLIGWCLSLAHFLCSLEPEDKMFIAVVGMGEKLDAEGLTFAAHICYVVAMEDLHTCQGSSVTLVGCNSLPVSQSALREAIERTEVYEYLCSLNTGFAQPAFQVYKYFHASKLAAFGLFDQAFDYCETIAKAITSFPHEITKTTMELTTRLSKRLNQGQGKEAGWLLRLRQLLANNVFKPNNSECGVLTSEMSEQQLPHLECHTSPQEVFESQYLQGELLGKGGFGSVYAGIRKADSKEVAIKYVDKKRQNKFITIPGEIESLPLEVALMKMVSTPVCENVLQLVEWFEMPECYVLILEQPKPCMDLFDFQGDQGGQLSEPLAQYIMYQVIQAARHCSNCGVLHRDIKSENLLINTETLQVKLIDFGCGDLLKDTPYTYYEGTRDFSPPEWLCAREYMGGPATIWSLGILLFTLVCGYLPFNTREDIVQQNMCFTPDISESCQDLICWCLDQDPHSRPTFEEILSHKWFQSQQA